MASRKSSKTWFDKELANFKKTEKQHPYRIWSGVVLLVVMLFGLMQYTASMERSGMYLDSSVRKQNINERGKHWMKKQPVKKKVVREEDE